MQKELQTLKQKYKTWQGVADFLQITYRHLCYIRSGKQNAGRSLEKLIRFYANRIKELD